MSPRESRTLSLSAAEKSELYRDVNYAMPNASSATSHVREAKVNNAFRSILDAKNDAQEADARRELAVALKSLINGFFLGSRPSDSPREGRR